MNVDPRNWPAAKPELRPIDKITPYGKNARTHPREQIDALARDMLTDGVTMPILVDENGIIIAGHGRLLAAQTNGFKKYPVVVARGWSETQKKAARLKDNQRGLQSGWDRNLLGAELQELKLADYDMPLIGFTEIELRPFLIETEPSKNPDAPTQVPAKPIVRAGDIWELGEHRIICGDSTDKATWERLMGAQKAAMVFTDPPYGVSYEAKSGEFEIIEGDEKRRDDLYNMLVKAFGCMAAVATAKAAFYIWHADKTRADFTDAMTAAGLLEKQYLVWAKPSAALGWGDYQISFEPCFYAAHAGEFPEFYGDRTNATVWRIEAVRSTDKAATVIGSGLAVLSGDGHMLYVQPKAPKAKKLREIRLTKAQPTLLLSDDNASSTVWEVTRDSDYVHPTQKPVALATKAIENSSRPGEIVIDGFSGSGTLLMGCEMTGRRARVVELDPKYVQAAIERWQTYTNRQATLADDGRTLEQIGKARGRTNGQTGAQVRAARGGGGLPADGMATAPDARRNAARKVVRSHERSEPVRMRKGAAGPGQKALGRPQARKKQKATPPEPPQA